MKEFGRTGRLDADAEQRLLAAYSQLVQEKRLDAEAA